MKNIFFGLIFSINAVTCWPQSFIGATIGVDFAKIEETDSTSLCVYGNDFNVSNNGFSVRSAIFGIQGEKHLSEKFSISINLLYTRKKMEASNCFFVPIEGVKLNSFSGIVAGKWYPVDYLYVGVGVSFSYLSNVRSYIHTGTEYQIELENKKKYGHLLTLGLRYKNFLIGPYFINGLNIGKKPTNVDLKPIDSYGFSLSYLLRVSKEKKR
jgi:hypothetical protein